MSNPFPPSRSDHEPARPATVRHTRRQEIEEVGHLWTNNRLTILSGHPGVGKSTLLHSGVVPAIEGAGELVLPVGRLTHHVAFPLAALPPQNHFAFPLLSSWSPDESPARLSESSIRRFLERRLRHDRFGHPSRTHLCIDQAETLFRKFPTDRYPELEEQRLRFLDDLFDTLRSQPHLRLLLVLRTAQRHEARAFSERLRALDVPTGDFQLTALRPDLFDAHDWHRLLAEELRTIRASGEKEIRAPDVEPSLFGLACARLAPEPPRIPEILADEVNRVLGEHVQRTLAVVAADHQLPRRRLEAWFRDAFIGSERPDHPEEAPPAAEVLRALEDRWLIRTRSDPCGPDHEIQHPRLREAVRAFPVSQVPMRGPDAAGLLREAAAAFWSGDFRLSRNHVEGVTRICRPQDLEIKAQAECLLGDLAYATGDLKKARERYEAAAGMFEALQNTDLVGHLLSADGRLSLKADPPAALPKLHAAVSRLPHDSHVLTALGQALWQTGQPRAALAVLNEALIEDRSNLEALRVRGEIRARLGEDDSLQGRDRIDAGAGGTQP
ncbi:tetratricopeptide repeat protein [Actinocorallia sp. B10E7]|uniref:tetratricopeptide repeat protein n=1 Tax=Actinocorallia sp. B10E7 TaxID=3153558 RepID=UPI00325DE2CD